MAASLNRERRVAALETNGRRRNRRNINIPMVVAELGESGDEAIARYVAEHGPLEEVEEGDVNVIVMVPVAPQERPVA